MRMDSSRMGVLWGQYILIIALYLPFCTLANESATEKLIDFIQTVNTFKARFSQTVVDEEGNIIEKADGLFMLSRPGQFRWDYNAPYRQHIVADGERIWFYDVALDQVTVSSQSAMLANTPATLLSGERVPEDVYLFTDLPSQNGLLQVTLTPKAVDTEFQTIDLVFSSEGLKQLVMKDRFDTRTILVFSQTLINAALADDVFVFSPPEGVDVIGETGL